MSLSECDVDVLARTIWGEARGEGRAGQLAVGWSIRNRVEMDLHGDGKPDWWGEGYIGVCQARWQFSCWNRNDPNYPYLSGARQIPGAQYTLARECAIAVMEGREPDPTAGATHYYATTMPKPPAWAASATRTCKIGRHIFYTDVP